MTTIASLPNGKWIVTYEFGGAPEVNYAVYYRIADDPLSFNSAPGQVLRATDGTVPDASPYVVWTPFGGPNGTIVVSAASNSEVFLNTGLAANGSSWLKTPTPATAAYSRNLAVMPNSREIFILGAGAFQGVGNYVNASVMALPT
jgi:hypothetical protein